MSNTVQRKAFRRWRPNSVKEKERRRFSRGRTSSAYGLNNQANNGRKGRFTAGPEVRGATVIQDRRATVRAQRKGPWRQARWRISGLPAEKHWKRQNIYRAG